MTYERDNIKELKAYVPGEQPDSGEFIKLNTNENPYPPAPEVQKTLAEFDANNLRRYPQPTSSKFREIAADLHKVGSENIIATRGGDELIRLAITTFVDPGKTVAMTEPTYSLYLTIARIQNCEILQVKLEDDWSLPENFADECNRNAARLTMVVNPHAPSGALLTQETIESLCNSIDGVLLVDEAYVDFIDPKDKYNAIPLIEKYDNLLILRTLSKGYSLAGLRFGYGIGHNDLVNPMLEKTRDSYNLDGISQKIAESAIKNQSYAQDNWDKVREQRQRLEGELSDLGLSVFPSQTNFLLVSVPEKISLNAPGLYQKLKEKGILVRYFNEPGLKDKLRISIGTEIENTSLIETLKLLLGK